MRKKLAPLDIDMSRNMTGESELMNSVEQTSKGKKFGRNLRPLITDRSVIFQQRCETLTTNPSAR